MVLEHGGTGSVWDRLSYSPDGGEGSLGSPSYEPVSALWGHRYEAPQEICFGPGVQLDEYETLGSGPPIDKHTAQVYTNSILARSSGGSQMDDISDRVTRMDIDAADTTNSQPANHTGDESAQIGGGAVDGRAFCNSIFTPIPDLLLQPLDSPAA